MLSKLKLCLHHCWPGWGPGRSLSAAGACPRVVAGRHDPLLVGRRPREPPGTYAKPLSSRATLVFSPTAPALCPAGAHLSSWKVRRSSSSYVALVDSFPAGSRNVRPQEAASAPIVPADVCCRRIRQGACLSQIIPPSVSRAPHSS